MFVIPVSRHSSTRPSAQSASRSSAYGADVARQIERLFKPEPDSAALRTPALDVSETAQSYVLQLDLPGVAKEAVKITINGRRINVDAEQSTHQVEKKDGEAANTAELIYRERAASRFSRSIVLPSEVSQSDSTAKLDLGVLTLTLAKRQPAGASHLPVL